MFLWCVCLTLMCDVPCEPNYHCAGNGYANLRLVKFLAIRSFNEPCKPIASRPISDAEAGLESALPRRSCRRELVLEPSTERFKNHLYGTLKIV